MNQNYYYPYQNYYNPNNRSSFLIPYALGLATGPFIIGAFGPGYGRRPFYPPRPIFSPYPPYRPF